ncbi:MAG TPA: c-type cytochrome [Bryobacteraceae bacterium]|nr:c-type cytochrome [Bryobacteraceae bacterium]
MKHLLMLAALLTTAACGVRERAQDDVPAVAPDQVMDFAALYAQNCSGCHGPSGRGGAAVELADPVYLSIAGDAAITRVTSAGVPGTAMPAFAQSSGGMLTDRQIGAIVRGMRSQWARPDVLAAAVAPPYAASQPGDPRRGRAAFATFCSSCHGSDGRGGTRASSIVDPSYLPLISDQGLRTAIIVGRPDLGAPDWRGDVSGRPMTPQEISDVVAWLAAQRPNLSNVSALQIPGGIR